MSVFWLNESRVVYMRFFLACAVPSIETLGCFMMFAGSRGLAQVKEHFMKSKKHT